jgi:hypothetical protein
MKCLTRLLCVFGLLLSIAFAESFGETRKKAEKGDAKAQLSLRVMYLDRYAVPMDEVEAVN